MTPRDHLQKMSIIGEQANVEGKHLYQLTGCMSAAELRQRQEIMMRNQMMAGNAQVMVPTQQRMPLMQSQFEPRMLERDLLPSGDLILPNDTRQLHVASQFGHSLPAHTGILSNRVFSSPGYGFLQTDPMDFVARRQELLQKHNMNRMELEMNAMYPARDIDKSQRKGFNDLEAPFLFHGISSNPMAVRGRQMVPEGHLPSDVFVHRNAFESLHGHAMLKTASPYPSMSNLQRERARRPGRRAGNQKATDHMGVAKIQADNKPPSPPAPTDEEKDEKKDEETGTMSKCDQIKTEVQPALDKSSSELQDPQKMSNQNIPREIANGRSEMDKGPNNTGTAFEERYIYQPPVHLSATPYSFPVAMNSPLLPGTQGLFLTREDLPSVEDIRKWNSQDVYNFILNLPGCSSYAQVFKDHDIDGLTLPLLTEEHLLDTMGLKLGPALKIRSQIICRLGNIFHMPSLQLTGSISSTAPMPPEHPSEVVSPLPCTNNSDILPSPGPQDQDPLKPGEIIMSENKENPCDLSMGQTDFQMNLLKS
ncbi:hypothetical protein XENTR_v10014527 [Xenopus tropicalis]|uniref:Sterile alpha motif domain-containing 7 n=1 Tax=Xenopus tropicalis TaxID=8364 RepID=F7DVA3_XENTR|nr:sterile alpha motif domain-containing protein 7 [Xenopus tropicalis]XP_012818863.1 sterile alpha motif domain-containing protein 7 [Xenopus tropicalis]XP_031758111.1 sterile alpha motif domain-containing protein 7 [Xenopus tropicalis]XP_031758112.1 sterile alpha motif domain-containing protein 7 [Xenopus tropicalis]KAE8603980.1 hypothetical protein XENTR_v10014527 [Xenopus tropicalis]KAE8603981.1 hypothetical protein XENTR_v10014527 [Xenopus tropicalis]KAE8603982.1 hypothetical protein XEN|eukprot:XP_012818863.1 PREDICTED: sterile alpha motif domain-containing protein 7 [Xenopus tropicalis]